MRRKIETEADWLEADYPPRMIRFLSERVTDRKEHLLAAACFRRVWRLLVTQRSQQAVEAFEQYVDGTVTAEQLAEAKEEAWQSSSEIPNPEGNNLPEQQALAAIGLSADLIDLVMRVAEATAWEKLGPGGVGSGPEERAQSVLIRDIFSNPFRPVVFDPRWQSETVVALATGIYAERAFDRMPILADALEEAGCNHADILTHCRGDGPHVRGCWVVDLVLGKQ